MDDDREEPGKYRPHNPPATAARVVSPVKDVDDCQPDTDRGAADEVHPKETGLDGAKSRLGGEEDCPDADRPDRPDRVPVGEHVEQEEIDGDNCEEEGVHQQSATCAEMPLEGPGKR